MNRDINEEVDHVESFALDQSQPDSKYRAINSKFSQIIQSPSVKSVMQLKRFRQQQDIDVKKIEWKIKMLQEQEAKTLKLIREAKVKQKVFLETKLEQQKMRQKMFETQNQEYSKAREKVVQINLQKSNSKAKIREALQGKIS